MAVCVFGGDGATGAAVAWDLRTEDEKGSGTGALGQHERGVLKEEGGGRRAMGRAQGDSAGPAGSLGSGWVVDAGATPKA